MSRSAFTKAGFVSRSEHISERVKKIIVSPIKEIAILAAEIPDCVPFAWGIAAERTPKHIRDHLKQALDTDALLGRYAPSMGLPVLRSAIADTLKRSYGICADPRREILVTAGAMEALMIAIQAVVNPGDEVILTSPGFSSYTEQVILAGGVPRYLPLDEKNAWAVQYEVLPSLITPKTKAILINSPCNPTGSIFSKEALAAIADAVIEHNLILITDEPYNFLVFDEMALPELVSDERLRKNRISCFSLSKEYAMTGYRIGYVFAEEGMLKQMLKVHDATIVSAPRPSQVAAIAALTGDQSCVRELTRSLQSRRDRLCKHMDRMPQWFSYVKPRGTYYLFARIIPPQEDGVQTALDILNEAHVAVVPGSAFGVEWDQYLRFCFGCTLEDIDKGMERIEKWFRG